MPTLDRSSTQSAIAQLQAEVQRRRWLHDPVAWVNERLGEHLWSKQQAILYSVRDHRLTAVPSAHGTGKSFLAARLACWWIATHPPGEAFVVTTATTWKQVEVVLWRELRRAHAKGHLPGRTNRTEWLMPLPGTHGLVGEEQVAIGHRPADTDPTAFQGIHAPYVLVIFDEATGIPKALWDSADSLLSTEESRMLAIGNPDDPLSEFAAVCNPGTGWNVIPISAFDSPNFTDEPVPPFVAKQLTSRVWVEEKERRWGKDNPLYISKVLGRFPAFAEDGLIPMNWIRDAQLRFEKAVESHPVEFGVDVGAGGDKNVIAARRGIKVRIVREDHQPDTMKTAKNIELDIGRHHPERVKIDEIGIGRGVVDALKGRSKMMSGTIVGVTVGQKAHDSDSYVNLRAEGYWHLRELFESGEIAIDPADEDLAAQLVDLRYEPVAGRIQIESKESMKRRGKKSPDRADAVMLAFLPPPKKKTKVTWGRKAGQRQGFH